MFTGYFGLSTAHTLQHDARIFSVIPLLHVSGYISANNTGTVVPIHLSPTLNLPFLQVSGYISANNTFKVPSVNATAPGGAGLGVRLWHVESTGVWRAWERNMWGRAGQGGGVRARLSNFEHSSFQHHPAPWGQRCKRWAGHKPMV